MALAVCALCFITFLELNLAYSTTLLYFIFYATITGYNFVKYFGLAKFHHRSLASWLKSIQLFSFFCFLSMCYFAVQLPFNTLLCLGILAVITFFYPVPFLPRRLFIDKHQNLRSISGLKVYIIALVWSCVTVLLPVLNVNSTISNDILILTIQRFCFVLLLILPFEIRDLIFDNLKLATIPQKIGIANTKRLGFCLALFILLLEIFKKNTQLSTNITLIVILILTTTLVIIAKKTQNRYYSSFWVEGIPILWGIILFFI